VKDFDNNGKTEQILAYNIKGEEYPFLAKDELERPLPILKKAYLTYGEVAGKTVKYILYDLFKDYVELKAETLSNSVFISDGKGGFTRHALADELQLSPIMSFAGMGSGGSFIAGGNFFGTIPYEGRYDAFYPSLFSFSATQSSVYATLQTITGEVRDMQWIKTNSTNKLLVIARNNEPLMFLKNIGELQTMK
jgi:hypothetical protein